MALCVHFNILFKFVYTVNCMGLFLANFIKELYGSI